MEWTRDTRQQSIILKIDFDKAYDRVDWTFISEMLICLGVSPLVCCHPEHWNLQCFNICIYQKGLVSSDFSASFYSSRMSFGLIFICLDNRCYRLLVGGSLYFSSNSWYSSPRDGFEMVNNHFVDDSHLLVRAEKVSVDGALACLDTFCSASGDIVNAHKTDFWLVGLDEIGSLLLGLIFYLGLLLDIWGFPLKLICCQLPCGIGFF